MQDESSGAGSGSVRLEYELRDISRSIDSLNNQFGAISSKVLEIERSVSEINPVSTKIDELRKHLLPISAYVAGFVVVVGVAGTAIYNIVSLKGPIDEVVNAGRQALEALEEASANVQLSGDAIQATSNEIQLSASSVSGISEEIQNILTANGAAIAQQLERIRSVDRVLSELLPKLNNANEASINSMPSVGSQVVDSILGDLAGEMPNQMRFLFEGQQLIDRGEYEKARERIERSRSLDADANEDGVYDFMIANSYWEQDEYEEAIKYYNRAIDIEDNIASYYNNIGTAQFSLARDTEDAQLQKQLYRESADNALRSVEIDPSNIPARVNASIALNALGEFNLSEQVLSEVLTEEDADLLRQLGATYALQDKVTAAISSVKQSLELEPSGALTVAVDDDFAILRENESFRSLLEQLLGDTLFGAVVSSWNSDDANLGAD